MHIKVNPLLVREREKASFDVRSMTYLLDGSKERTELKERIAKLIESDDILRNRDESLYLPREKSIEYEWRRVAHAIKIIRERNLTQEEADTLLYYLGSNSGFKSTHLAMFVPTLENQTTQDQKKKLYPLAKNYQILGTYAQTELAHGSNVRGLETTATYDVDHKEFILHSPTMTSTKWWPGALGKLANYAIVYAQLIIKDKKYGIHGFIVPIRSLEDHTPLPGVTVGDIGPKMGFSGVDNGFLRLDHVRIPRENMLARFASVEEDGTYKQPPHQKIGYGTMMFVRSRIVYEASNYLARACTISIRYSAIRQQFPPRGSENKGVAEVPVLDYQTQQYRLLPLLATAYAFHFTGNYMVSMYNKMQEKIKTGDMSMLSISHAISSGLKAITTEATANGIEECRKCCGGHGYSHLSGLPELFSSYVPNCTFEGENILLLLQTASFVLKQQRKGRFLNDLVDDHVKPTVGTSEFYVKMFAQRAKKIAEKVSIHVAKLAQELGDENEAWNRSTVDLVKMARAFCFSIIVTNFGKELDKVTDDRLRKVLRRLTSLFALYYMEKDLGEFMEVGLLTMNDADRVHKAVIELLRQIRPDAVALVDSFNYPDYLLRSCLGRYDGNVYEHMYEQASSNGLNTPENDKYLREAFIKYVKPLQSKL